MSARTVSVTLSANVGGFVGAMGKAASSVDQVTSKMGESAKGIAQSAATNSQAWNTVGSTLTRVGAVAAAGLGVAAKAAVDWESAFAGVRKTVDQSSPAFATLENDLRGMAREMATSHTEIASVAEAAGALGVATEDVAGFTRTMVMLGETTNLTANEAAESIAQFTNIMGTAPDQVDNLGSALVALGNNGASTERQIVQMGQRIAAAGSQVGLSEAQVLGFASAVASTGVEVEAGGTAVSNGFAKMSKAVREGGQELELMAKTAGMSAAEFKTAFETDAAGAITSFVEGLGRAHEAGQNMDDILGALGITGIREADTFKRLALSGNLLRDSLTTANDAFRDGSALMDEYGERAKTTESKMRVAWNQIKDAAISTGQVMLPVLGQMAQGVGAVAGVFGSLPQPVQAAGAALTGVVAAAGLGAGAFMRAVPAIVEFRAASATLAKDMPKTAAAMSGLGKAAGGLLALTAVVGVLGAIDASMRDTVVNAESLGNAFTAMNKTAGESGGGIQHLNTQFQQLHQNVGFIGIGEQLNGIGDAMQRVSNPAFGAGIDRFFHELGVGTSTTIEAENAFKALDTQLVQMNPAQAAQGFAQIAEEAKRFGITAEQLIAMFPQYAAQIQGWANANKFAFQDGAAGAQELINMMGGQLPPALAAAGAAAGLTAGEIDGMARTLAAVPPNTTVAVSGEGILPTTTTVEGLRDAIKDVPDDKYIRIQMPDGTVVEGEAKKVRAALDAMGEEKNIRVATPGMPDVLIGLTTLKTNLADVPDDKQISVSIDGGAVAGIQMRELGDHIKDVPDDKPIKVTIPGIGEVTLRAGDLKRGLDEIPENKDVKATVDTAAATPRAKELDTALDAIPSDKKITIRGVGIDETVRGAGDLKAELAKIDPEKEITVWMDGKPVIGKAGEIYESLQRLEDRDVKVRLDAETAKLDAFKQALTDLPENKQITIASQGIPETQVSMDTLRATVRDMPDQKPIKVTMPGGEEKIFTAGQLRDIIREIDEQKNINVTSNAAEEKAKVDGLQQALIELDPSKQITFSAPGLPETKGTIDTLKATLEGMPPDKPITITLPGAEPVILSAQQVRDIINQIEDKNVNINADAAGAINGAGQAQRAVDGVRGKTVDVGVNAGPAISGSNSARSAIAGVVGKTVNLVADASGAIAGARLAIQAIAGVQGKTVTINVQLAGPGASRLADGGMVVPEGFPGPEHVGAQRFAPGGRVAGWSPHPRADNVPAWLTAGEIVQSNAAGDMYGRHRLLALNAGKVDPVDFAEFMRAQGFAAGGQVGMVRDAFQRPPTVTTVTSGTAPPVMPGPGRTVNQEFHYHYPIGERESTATRRAASAAALGGML